LATWIKSSFVKTEISGLATQSKKSISFGLSTPYSKTKISYFFHQKIDLKNNFKKSKIRKKIEGL
jgi:hypothetical protein